MDFIPEVSYQLLMHFRMGIIAQQDGGQTSEESLVEMNCHRHHQLFLC